MPCYQHLPPSLSANRSADDSVNPGAQAFFWLYNIPKAADRVIRFDVEGQEVTCHETGGDRLWHCARERSQLNLTRSGQKFCQHTAVAIMRAMQDGTIDVERATENPMNICAESDAT